jgi:hypothetical protein
VDEGAIQVSPPSLLKINRRPDEPNKHTSVPSLKTYKLGATIFIPKVTGLVHVRPRHLTMKGLRWDGKP